MSTSSDTIVLRSYNRTALDTLVVIVSMHPCTRYKSPRKAVMFACFVMGMGLYLIIAGTVQVSMLVHVYECVAARVTPWVCTCMPIMPTIECVCRND